MRRVLAAAIGALLLGCSGPAGAQQMVADLTQHLVAITTGFTGASVTLFGAVDGGGDIVVTVRGPERETVVRRKTHVAGIWLNKRSMAFASVPGYYAVLSTRPIAEIAPPALRQLHEIGVDALKLNPTTKHDEADTQAFRAALVEGFEKSGLFSADAGQIAFLGDRLFRATLNFPATVPTGTYSIQVFLLRKGDVVAAQTTPLTIAQTGFEAELNDFSTRQPAIYGVVAVLAAAMAGWLASYLFRSA